MKNFKRRKNIIREILETEKSYLDKLTKIIEIKNKLTIDPEL
jgi:hypothetical protein